VEPRVSLITLGVADFAHARTSYERLGFKASSMGGDEIVFFQIGPLGLSLFPRESLACDANVPADGSGFRGITLAHNVCEEDEVAGAIAEAVNAGGRLVKPPSRRR
jgi:hypothetical protein